MLEGCKDEINHVGQRNRKREREGGERRDVKGRESASEHGFRLKISIMEIRDAKVRRLNPGIVPGIVIELLSLG